MTSFEGSTLFSQINYHDKKRVYLFEQVFRSLSATDRVSWPYGIVFIFVFSVRKCPLENYTIMHKGFTIV